MTHRYDDPTLGPIQFLLAIMHDPTLELGTRQRSAALLLPITDPYDFRATGPAAIIYRLDDYRPSPPQEDDHDCAA